MLAEQRTLTSAHLFCGGGGDTDGAVRAGFRRLWGVESDRYAAAVFRQRFPETMLVEADVKTLSDEFVRSLPISDLFIFGSPCPDFSTAGHRTGIDGVRGSLFFEGLRFLRLKKFKAFIFENVQGIFSSGNGEDFRKVISALGELGYVGTWQLRNGRRWVPQNRSRVFVVGYLRECAVPQSGTKQADTARMLRH